MRWVVKNSWNKVVISNESIMMIGHDQQIHFWCKRNEGSRPDLVQPRTSQTRYKVMIGGLHLLGWYWDDYTGKWEH